jgi:HAD superfamily hydrolase (TIGR01509 family)
MQGGYRTAAETEPGDTAFQRLDAVLFDMDGLLVDSEPLWFEVEQAVMARLGGHWTEADQRKLVGGSLHSTVGYLMSRGTREASHDEVAGWLIGGMADLLAEREVTVMPGAAGLLAEVRAAGLPSVLVTSSERIIMDAVLASLIRHGISFTATVCGADVTAPKPDPQPYLLAASRIGADPRSCVALEDSPNGVAAALAAGCVTVAVPGVARVREHPGLTIAASLTEVDLARLRSLMAASRPSAAVPGHWRRDVRSRSPVRWPER